MAEKESRPEHDKEWIRSTEKPVSVFQLVPSKVGNENIFGVGNGFSSHVQGAPDQT